ncbi:unnamed protein product [Meloidogyne enterolobii]|uniref:Uncharacterized protein n=1 Tax=Meloidogyne enterolobii TaxID=390850 RepID=A0ACB1A1M9_MELEN
MPSDQTNKVKPDPGYKFRRQFTTLVEDWQKHDSDSQEDKQFREETILPKIKELVIHNLNNNGENEACDLLMEIERIDLLSEMAEESEFFDCDRICNYILSASYYIPDPENITMIDMARDLYMHFGKNIEALRCAMRTNNIRQISSIVKATEEGPLKIQMALMLGRQQIFLTFRNKLYTKINGNCYLHQLFFNFVKENGYGAIKSVEDVYKTSLEPDYPLSTKDFNHLQLKQQTLSASFVNGFVHVGFGADAFFKDEKSTSDWLAKHKEWDAFSAAATFGLIHHWNVDSLNNFEILTQSKDIYVKGGALLAVGVVFAGVQHPDNQPLKHLQPFLSSEHLPLRVASIFGLGLAYGGSRRQSTIYTKKKSVLELLKKSFSDESIHQTEVKGLAALSLGFILIGLGKGNGGVVDLFMDYFVSGVDLSDKNLRLVALGIGLIFLGRQNECDETILEPLRALSDPFGKIASTLVDVCAYAGTGNVLKVQEMLHICSDPNLNETFVAAVAVIGISLIAMGEDIGSQMCLRHFTHLRNYGSSIIKRALPFALALLSPSNPVGVIVPTLGILGSDNDMETAINAIFALGLVGAGTNNSHIMDRLRRLASRHASNKYTMFILRIAQGLIHLGKGTMTLNPFHSDGQILCLPSLGALLCTCLAFIDSKQTVLGDRQHYLLFSLVAAIHPKMLITAIIEKSSDIPVTKNLFIDVGDPVDVAGLPGEQRPIKHFAKVLTPILLGHGERAQLEDEVAEEYETYTPVLEGIVICKRKQADI